MEEVAERAQVSLATVDRVLHGRAGVRASTVQRVMRAAADIGYVSEAQARTTLGPKPLRLAFLIPEGSNRFLRMLGDLIGYSQEHWAPFNVRCQAEYIEAFNPEALARQLLRHGRKCDGIAFMALEHPLVREAVADLAARGVPTVTLISDLSNSSRSAYVGLDNRAAGRTAAYLIARFMGAAARGRTAKVAMIAGSLSYRAHEEREAGFLHLFEEQCPDVHVVGLREGHDDAEKNYRQARALFEQHGDLSGIYNIGGGAEGIGRAIHEARLARKPVFIGHGLTPDTRALLIDGTMDAVITQNPQGAVMNCVRIFANLRDGREPNSGVEQVRSQVIFRENLP
ncbi:MULTISPECIES: LacI family DNA-binding transcriptional regulator [Ramlibacter]|uniref:Substrate-binding domain-containing protein n=1 Tax=Ramlibacter pinisoli TaxID=2682844 RepID=A0A6N8IZ41_9BURK|nr:MULTISPECIES: LacI family DNA-binding transcriptional regulator [Ramlibacter]MBA2961366.1 LacI family DNA-binding transcriptional regulator [Ramlibacter sp. CGMCC 1.13660]MVQ31310.1 substrate-binding domain-containing protein [Ramlibacter pinisoli]